MKLRQAPKKLTLFPVLITTNSNYKDQRSVLECELSEEQLERSFIHTDWTSIERDMNILRTQNSNVDTFSDVQLY